jgi:biopolymer transport protein ExbB/TolQ
MGAQARAAEKNFWKAPSVQEGAAALKKSSPFRFIAETGIEATSKHTGLLEKVDMNEWITMSIQRAIDNVQSRTQDGLAFLATVGSTAPFVGLFGTVWGIYHALTAIGIAGQASIDKVAGPVGEALIMTAFGLAVAVPAVLGYNWLVRRNKSRDGARPQLRRRSARRPAQHDPEDRAQGISRVDERRKSGRRRRSRLDDQHDAARRRDARAADHLPDHHSGGHDVDSRSSCPRK